MLGYFLELDSGASFLVMLWPKRDGICWNRNSGVTRPGSTAWAFDIVGVMGKLLKVCVPQNPICAATMASIMGSAELTVTGVHQGT